MTITARFVNHGVRILAALALLAMLLSPIRLTKTFHPTPSPSRLPRRYAMLEAGRTGHLALSARLSMRESHPHQAEFKFEDELDPGIEDELTEASPLVSVLFEVLPSPRPELNSRLVSFAVAPAVRPLRC